MIVVEWLDGLSRAFSRDQVVPRSKFLTTVDDPRDTFGHRGSKLSNPSAMACGARSLDLGGLVAENERMVIRDRVHNGVIVVEDTG